MILVFCFFFFKQKTAYEWRISDWSSDVCSSDLPRTWPNSSNITTTGESPCAVFPSAARALYSTFIGNPIKRLPDGMTRMSFVSSGERCDIFQARLNTSAAWSRDRAPDTIWARSEEHTSELQSLMRISYAVFCLKKKNKHTQHIHNHNTNN